MIKILFILFLVNFLFSDQVTYLWPTDEIDQITTTFCEPRYRRFHAGIDVRTFGRINDNLYAIESGYISRIKIMPNKYGKAIYLSLNDGNIVLYSHLNKFSPSIELFCNTLMKKYDSSFFDHILTENEIMNINKGDIIGYSGDTGSLSGPHLHFEIRDPNNQPINPLIDFYSIYDIDKPYANNIAFIPKDNNCWIDGIQDYQIYELIKINDYKYVFEDTISTIGNFGIALEAYDKVSNQPFKYGIYNIELYIDDLLQYSTTFDKYNFNQDNMIYNIIDYHLLNESNSTYYKLFNDVIDNDPFNSHALQSIRLDENFHNIIININDANDNMIQVQGVVSGNAFYPPELSYHINNDNNYVMEQDFNYKNLNMHLTTRYNDLNDKREIFFNTKNNILESKSIIDPYNIIEYYYKRDNIKSKKNYLSLVDLDPYKIKGQFNIKPIDDGIIIEFKEDFYSGYNPILIINKNDTINTYRKNKTTLSTGIIEYNEFAKIISLDIVYKTNPEIIFTKSIKIINKNYTSNNINIINNKNFLFEEKNINLKNYNYIIKPFSIYALQDNFYNLIRADFNLTKGCINCCLFKLNKKKDNWSYIDSPFIQSKLETEIYTNEIYSVIEDSNKPIIKNIYPAFGGTYQIDTLTEISFETSDGLSGIDPYSLGCYINEQKVFIEYIPYRDLIRANIDTLLKIGHNTIKVIVFDNAGNSIETNGVLTIIE